MVRMKPGGGGGAQETPKTQEKSSTEFAVQCGECFKWRLVPTKEEFEDIRSKFIEEPWVCNNKNGVSCEDPEDIKYDSSKIWAIDKPNIPKTPAGFERILVLRKDFSKFDAYYVTPTGKRVRAITEIGKYLEAHPEYNNVSVSDFSFASPKVMEDTIPRNVDGKNGGSSGKKRKTSMMNDDDDDD
ncbi:methyl-CpG-binding domain-containing protein 4-like [Telopea speciosissima]|uniref:methyl-CpG-binding domain-containing protein 4-like n=1 Tax=Telopea speciosissima TaxID=54955 RepID=UPI001CC6CE12|nr:methyl-CpG-binding domain-containing protein 4-like [Telopea speciosissima]